MRVNGRSLSRWLVGGFFMAAGLFHFLIPAPYLHIMPPYLPAPRLLVQISGVAEVGLGFLALFARTAPMAGWGLIALLIAVFPVHLHMLVHRELFPHIPLWALWARLPLQGCFIVWVYRSTRLRGFSDGLL